MRSAILGLLAVISWPAAAASPYPQSELISGITWDTGSWRSGGAGGDIWPVTWTRGGPLATAWGDGVVGCGRKVSYGVATISSAQPSTSLNTVFCGPGPSNRGKILAILDTSAGLYANFVAQGSSGGSRNLRSTNGGRTWSGASGSTPFVIWGFVQFGQGNQGAPGGFAYALRERGTSLQLVRVPVGAVQSPSSYEYFSGTSAAPAWSRSSSRARAIFSDPDGALHANMTYNPGLNRYLLTVSHSLVRDPSSNRIGIFEAPNPWGPWSTISYVSNFLGLRGGYFLGLHFPIKWQSDGGRTLWATFSCYAQTSCGRYHDRFNLMRATLQLR